MKHIYKAGGEWKTKEGADYSIKCVNHEDFPEYINDGWSNTLAEALEKAPKKKATKKKVTAKAE